MSGVEGGRCAAISRALGEPMAGTAPSTRRWLCLERPAAWPGDIHQYPDPVVRRLLTRAGTHGFRPLLIRDPRPGAARGPSRLFLADTVPGGAHLTSVAVERLEHLDDLVLPGPDRPLPGEPVTVPLLLVCTHDRRDPCCGLDGRRLVDALDGPGVFECSHLGGHRFAPTALLLPTGYVYGALDPGTAAEIRTRAEHGGTTVENCRGRCTWSPKGQVAELAVRALTGLHSPDALVVQDDDGDVVHVRTAGGRRWAVDVEPVDHDAARPASCGARATLMAPLRATAVRSLGHGS